MSKNILIIGNGFDLFHKLPTRYTDFLTFAKNWDSFKEVYDSFRNDEGEKMGKGITLSAEEAASLRDILIKLDI